MMLLLILFNQLMQAKQIIIDYSDKYKFITDLHDKFKSWAEKSNIK